MKLFYYILIYFSIIRGGNIIDLRNVYFLENNFWCTDKKEIKLDKGYLFRIAISIEGKSGNYVGVYHDSTTCLFFKRTNLRYIVLDEVLTNEIDSINKSSKGLKLFLKFQFLYTDELIEDDSHFRIYEGERRNFVTYKLLEKNSDNKVNLISDGIEIRKHHIKEMFKGFVYIKNLLKLDEYIDAINKKTSNRFLENLEDKADFKLHFFNDYSICVNKLVEFTRNLKHFSLVDDLSNTLNDQNHKRFIDKKSTLKVSQFKKLLIKMFDEECTHFKFDYSETCEKSKALKCLFIQCCMHLKDEIIANNILFPIGGKYNIDFYLKKMFHHILKSLRAISSQIIITNNEKNCFIFEEIITSLDISIEEFQINSVKNLCESKYVLKHFSTLVKRDIEALEDYINLEKIVVDYCNTFVYVANCVLKFENSLFSTFPYSQPIYIDDYKYRIVEGYEVNFESSENFERIKAFDNEGKEFFFEKNIDFFTDKLNRCYSTIEVLKTKNVHETKVIMPVKR